MSWEDVDTLRGEIGRINLADPSAPWDTVPAQWTGFSPAIAADPSDSGVLVAATHPPASGPTMAAYNVTDPSAVTVIDSSTSTSCGYNYPTVLPGGKTFLCGGFSYSTATLTPDRSGASYPGFTAIAPNGAVAVGNHDDILGYPAGAAAPTASYDQFDGLPLPSPFTISVTSPVGLAWAANSQQLFAVIESVSDSDTRVYSLVSLFPFERVPAPLTLTSTATTIGYDGSFTVTPHLGVTDGNRAYSVYRTIAGHPRQLVYSCPCDPSGSFTTSGSSWTTNTTYTATFSGDARYQPTTVNLEIKVGAKVSSALSGYYKLAEAGGLYHVYHRTATLKDLVTVAPNKIGECARLQVQQASHGVWGVTSTTGCMDLNKYSQTLMSRKLGPTGWFRVRADYTPSAKDTTNVGAQSGWLYYVVTS